MGEILHTDNIRRWICTVSMHISTSIIRADMKFDIDERFIKNFVNCWKTDNWVEFYLDKFSGRKLGQYMQQNMYTDPPDFITDKFHCDILAEDAKSVPKIKSMGHSDPRNSSQIGNKQQLWVIFFD